MFRPARFISCHAARDNNHRETHANVRCLPFNLSHKLPPGQQRLNLFAILNSCRWLCRDSSKFNALIVRLQACFDVSSARSRVISTIRKLGRERVGKTLSRISPRNSQVSSCSPNTAGRNRFLPRFSTFFQRSPPLSRALALPAFSSLSALRLSSVHFFFFFYVYSSLFTHGRSRA